MSANESRPIDAYQKYLFTPLSINRIRRAVALAGNQPSDEARYQDHDVEVFPSEMTQAQPLVPDGYGNGGDIEIDEGGGGLSGAATDVARLIAILISQKDNPAINRATLVNMFSAGVKEQQLTNNRAGYGFDALSNLGNGQFYGQKGGSSDVSSSVLQLAGDWGFTMLWGSGQPGNLNNPNWYPQLPRCHEYCDPGEVGPNGSFSAVRHGIALTRCNRNRAYYPGRHRKIRPGLSETRCPSETAQQIRFSTAMFSKAGNLTLEGVFVSGFRIDLLHHLRSHKKSVATQEIHAVAAPQRAENSDRARPRYCAVVDLPLGVTLCA